MLGGIEGLISLTRAVLRTCGRAKSELLRARNRRGNRLIKVTILLLAVGLMFDGKGRAWAQHTGQVYHAVGPAMFTNAAAWGYADGELVRSNFLCGVYAGADTNALKPCFELPGRYLKRPFTATGTGHVVLWGSVVVDAPAMLPLLLQFRAWPAEFGNYEEAVASGVPSPPVGVSEIVPAIPNGWIVEVPIEIGPLWVAPLGQASDSSPPLVCTLVLNLVTLSWPTNALGFQLFAASSLTSNALWSPVDEPVVAGNGQNRVSVPVTNAFQFFRLRR
jgi:hypothetical protein